MILEICFWICALCAIYSYFLYPLALKLIAIFRRGVAVQSSAAQPASMTLIVTAYNEEKRIREKIENTLAIEFDRTRLELIVASDCSDDMTDAIVLEYADRGVRLVRAAERLGKENAQLTAIQAARGDILVFSDVATQIPRDALQILEKYFADQTVGAVSSEDRFISQDGTVAGEGAYVKYEMWLRKQESQLAGLVGLSGSFFAARKAVCRDWDIHSPSDFNTALNTAKAGLRAVSAPDVLGFYQDLKDPSKEYPRKVRTVLRGMTGLSRHTEVLNIFSMGLFSFQVISHKLMRWLAPWFFIATFLLNLAIYHHNFFYSLLMLGQIVFYALAFFAHWVEGLREISIVKIIYFFNQVNIAVLDAAVKFLTGKRMTTWKPSAR